MASSWDIPHITYVGTHESLGDKHEFPILSRLSYNMNLFAKFYIEVLNVFNWIDIANIYDANVYLCNLVGQSLEVSFRKNRLILDQRRIRKQSYRQRRKFKQAHIIFLNREWHLLTSAEYKLQTIGVTLPFLELCPHKREFYANLGHTLNTVSN